MGNVNIDKLRKRKEELDSKKGNFDYDLWTPKDGRNVIRVLPPKGDSEDIHLEAFVHFNVGPDEKMVYCIGKKCPVCAAVQELKESKSKEDQKLGNDMSRRSRMYLNIVDREEEENDDGTLKVQVGSVGPMILGGILDYICDADYGDITDFEEGYDIVINRTGKGRKTDYTVKTRPKTSAVTDLVTEEELDEMLIDLETIPQYKTPEEIEAILYGDDDENEDLEEDERPKKKGSSSKKNKDDEEEDERPKRGSSSKKNKDEEDDEPPKRTPSRRSKDEEDEEDEEEDRPKKGSKGNKKNSEEDDLKDEIKSTLSRRRRAK